MDIICRIMFEMPQEYFFWVNGTAAGRDVPVPTIACLIDLVATHRASCLAALPQSWYLMHGTCQHELPPASPAQSLGTPSRGGSALSVTNVHADAAIKRPFVACGHATIGTMMHGCSVDIPKHSNKPICLAWALRGACHSNCKRAAQHKRYSVGMLKAVNAMLTQCGLAEDTQ
jgi:hypothetical protein